MAGERVGGRKDVGELVAVAGGSRACVELAGTDRSVRILRNLCTANAFAFVNVDVNGFAVDFHLQKQKLLERAAHVETKARCENNAQSQDILRALALLYREMANELEESSVIPKVHA